MAALIIGVYVVSRFVISARDPAQLRFVESISEQTAPDEINSAVPVVTFFSGNEFETAQRLREAGALGMAVSLSAFATYSATGDLPPTADILIHDLVNRKLLPPGIEIRGSSVQSELSLFRLTYRRSPFSFEIVSLPTDASKGPAMLFRFPLPQAEANSVMYFESSTATVERMPEPFTTTEQLAALGWSIRHWRGEALPLDASGLRELQEHDVWLKSINQGGR
ncbi:MAG: hypothetical protein ACRD6X_01315 [Pyrinomonadaceae bacterium]